MVKMYRKMSSCQKNEFLGTKTEFHTLELCLDLSVLSCQMFFFYARSSLYSIIIKELYSIIKNLE